MKQTAILSILALLLILFKQIDAAETQPIDGESSASTTTYRLFPGDLLAFRVFDHEDLSLDIRVPASGGTTIPLIGDIGIISGRPLSQVQEDIRSRLAKDYLVDPVITLMVIEYGPRQAVVMGAVEQSTAVELNPLLPTTAIQAIGQARGFSEDADRVKTVVLRTQTNGTVIALPVPASDDAVEMGNDQVLEHGDLVVVPRLDRIFIIGEVSDPGAVILPNQQKLTVSKAISLRGGFDRFARSSGVILIRDGKNISINIDAVLSGKSNAVDPELIPGDTVYVPASRF